MNMFRWVLVLVLTGVAMSLDNAARGVTSPEVTVAPYGSWKSPITADMLVAKSVRLGDLSIDGDVIYWSESRPEEGGRSAIVRRTGDGKTEDVLPAPFSARTTANEYGGGAFLAAGGVVYF
jgi:hypothetical protein